MSYKDFKSKEEYMLVMERVIEECMEGICIANTDGEFLYTNKAHGEFTGFSREMMSNMTASDVARNIEANNSTTLMVLERKKEVMVKQSMKGGKENFIVKGIPYFDEKNEVKYVISALMDVSKIQQLKEVLEKERHEKEKLEKEVASLKKSIKLAYSDEEKMVFKSGLMTELMDKIVMIGASDATVLITGESGTGKEMIARELHNKSDRKNKPFYKMNCGAIPESLMESELFGYETGTFTGGNYKGKKGILEYANGGTVLLDEIATMPLNLQTKLLRVLQEKEFTKIGGHNTIKIDIRFIASTNGDLPTLIKEGKFREDLFYRLNVIPIYVPPLRERKEDISILLYYFLNKFNLKYNVSKKIDSQAVASLLKIEFKGNVRELRNLVERLVLLSSNENITAWDVENLRIDIQKIDDGKKELKKENGIHEMLCKEETNLTIEQISGHTLQELIEEFEKNILLLCKEKFKSTYKIADFLGVNQSTVVRKLSKYSKE